jgi:hypothetical protein
MALPTGYHVQMIVTDESGNLVKMLPVSVADDVQIDISNNNKIPSTITNLQELANALGSLAFIDSIPASTTTTAGIVKLSNATDDTTAESTAATTKAVSEVATIANGAVQIEGAEDVSGVKNFTNGIVVGSHVTIESTKNTSTGDTTTTFTTK